MEEVILSGIDSRGGVDSKLLKTFQKSFVQVQDILDQNRLLINEIHQNQSSKIADNLGRNVGLIRELNNNIRKVVDLYADLSTSFTNSVDDDFLEGQSSATFNSDGRDDQKRTRTE